MSFLGGSNIEPSICVTFGTLEQPRLHRQPSITIGGRSKHWIKIEDRTHPAMERVLNPVRNVSRLNSVG
jgi:hypothetical protein